MPRWGERMDQLERALTTSYEWCSLAHESDHIEVGGGAFMCRRCSTAPIPDVQAVTRATAAQGMARPHWTNGNPPQRP